MPDNYLGGGVNISQEHPELLRCALLMQNLCEWAVVILNTAVVWSTRFQDYMGSLQEGKNWAPWDSVKSELDEQVVEWLKDCDLRTIVDDDEIWKVKCESLRELVGQALEDLHVGTAS